MIATSWIAILALSPGLPNQAATYSDATVNLAFDYPTTWSVIRKSKDMTRFAVPIPESSEKAELEVSRTPFHSSKEIWQTIQLRINEQLKRTMVRQFEQDVADVPFLFTQVSYEAGGSAKTTLTGLYYARTPIKILFRLTAPTEEFDKANYVFQQALQSIRSVDGSKPQVDDENIELKAPAKAPPAPPRRTVIKETGNTGKATEEKLVDIALTVSTKPVVIKVPEGWSSSNVEGGVFELRHPDLSQPIRFELRNSLDSEPPLNALFKLSSASLNKFAAVTKREDTSDVANRAGCRISTVWRTGKSTQGDIAAHEALGVQDGFYFLTSFETSNLATLAAERKLVRSLWDSIRIVPTQ